MLNDTADILVKYLAAQLHGLGLLQHLNVLA